MPERLPNTETIPHLILEPTYLDSGGEERDATVLEAAVQQFLAHNIHELGARFIRYIDDDSGLDVEQIDTTTPAGGHVPIYRYTHPNGTLSHIELSGAGVMGKVTNQRILSEADGTIHRISPYFTPLLEAGAEVVDTYSTRDAEDIAEIIENLIV